jgi:hypothetical protein
MTALRVLLGWLVVIGIAVYAIQHPEQVMQAVADVIEAIANWITQQTST